MIGKLAVRAKTTLQFFTFIFPQHRYWHSEANDSLMFSLVLMLFVVSK